MQNIELCCNVMTLKLFCILYLSDDHVQDYNFFILIMDSYIT